MKWHRTSDQPTRSKMSGMGKEEKFRSLDGKGERDVFSASVSKCLVFAAAELRAAVSRR